MKGEDMKRKKKDEEPKEDEPREGPRTRS